MVVFCGEISGGDWLIGTLVISAWSLGTIVTSDWLLGTSALQVELS